MTTERPRTIVRGTNNDLIAAARVRAQETGRKMIQGRGHLGGLMPVGQWIAVVPMDATSAQDDRGEIFLCDTDRSGTT